MSVSTAPSEEFAARWSTWLGEDVVRTARPPLASLKPSWGPGSEPVLEAGAGLAAAGFALIEPLGEGGMGVVHLAREESLRREVAVKTLREAGARPHAMFLAEAWTQGRLAHPNIVPIHRLDFDAKGEPFLAMPLVRGETWHEVLRGEPAEDLPRHLGILLQLSQAVAFAHNHGIVHNDLKPANVMLGEYGEVLLMDWGLAVSCWDAAPAGLRHRSAIDSPCGTPGYMAPELARGDGPALGPWTDVYLLGGILFRLLSGRAPHLRETFLASVTAATVAELPELAEAWPEELRALLRVSLAKEPAARPDVKTFAEGIRGFLQHRESLAISADARATLEGCLREDDADRGRYDDFAEAVAGFGNALRLWPGNAEAASGRTRARLAYARAALGAGDLGVAEGQLARLERPEDGEALRAEIAAEHARRQRRERGRRRLRVGLIAALAVIVLGLGGALFTYVLVNAEMEEKNARITSAMQRAVEEEGYARRRGQLARDAWMTLVSEVRSQLLFDVMDGPAQSVTRALLHEARRGFEALAEADRRRNLVDRGSAATLIQLAHLALDLDGDHAAGRALAEQAVAQLEQLCAAEPDDVELVHSLVVARLRLAQALQPEAPEQARELLRASLSLATGLLQGERVPDAWCKTFADLHARLAQLHLACGDVDAAEEAALVALDRGEQLAREHPDVLRFRLDLVVSWRQLAEIKRRQEKSADAELEAGRIAAEAVAAEWPGHAEVAYELSVARLLHGDRLRADGAVDEALAAYRASLEARRELAARAPASHFARTVLAEAWLRVGGLLRQLGRFDEAEEALDAALAIDRALAEGGADERRNLGVALTERAELARAQGALEAARGFAEEALAATEADPRARATSLILLGEVLCAAGSLDEAREILHAARVGAEVREQSRAWAALVALEEQAGRLQAALEAAEARFRLCEELVLARPEGSRERTELGRALLDLGRVREKSGDVAGAFESYEAGEVVFAELAAAAPGRTDHARALFDSRTGRLGLLVDQLPAAELEADIEALRALAATLPAAPESEDAYRYVLMVHAFGLREAGEPARADAVFVELLERLRAYAAAAPEDPARRRELSVGLKLRADLLVERVELDAALPLREEGLALQRSLADAAPSVERLHELAVFLRDAATLALARDDPAEARALLAEEQSLWAGLRTHGAPVPDGVEEELRALLDVLD